MTNTQLEARIKELEEQHTKLLDLISGMQANLSKVIDTVYGRDQTIH